MTFFVMQMKLIFTRKVLQVASFWKRDILELWIGIYLCLVPVRHFPRPFRSIHFGDIPKANGWKTSDFFAQTTWQGTRQRNTHSDPHGWYRFSLLIHSLKKWLKDACLKKFSKSRYWEESFPLKALNTVYNNTILTMVFHPLASQRLS